MARFSLIRLNLIRSEGALSHSIEIASEGLWAASGHTMVGICKFWGFCCCVEKIKLWGQERLAKLAASGQAGAKGREGKGGWPAWAAWKKSCWPDGGSAFFHLSLRLWTCHLPSLEKPGKCEPRLFTALSWRAGPKISQGEIFRLNIVWPFSSHPVFLGPFPVTLYFLGLFQTPCFFGSFSSHPSIRWNFRKCVFLKLDINKPKSL